ncbi:spore coat protein [Bacillus salipaludis]|uniref:spore coat protein n=1 Tax=Bacillus salipaludis TaxID=2547811 RepID=UPI002E1A2211|nr:spore coat protein [Bacillus salipaludis]
MEDFLDPRNAEGMPNLADSAFAMDFLLSVKTGIRNYSFAITETTNPELRTHCTSKWMLPLNSMGKLKI